MTADVPLLVDAHVHLHRSQEHGQEMWEYFLGRTPGVGMSPVPPCQGTVEEYRAIMSAQGITHANLLMFTWSGRYLRDGLRILADDEPRRRVGLDQLRGRIVERVRDNNRWAAALCNDSPELTYFCGVDPVLMGEHELVAELDYNRQAGAVGVKVVFYDLRISPDDPRLRPVYTWCDRHRVPLLSEGGHTVTSFGRPAAFESALRELPDLRLVFAHLGHSARFGEDSDADVVRLARTYGRVWADVSMRLEGVADGNVSPERFVAQLRSLGPGRALFGSNYPINEMLRPHGRVDQDDPQVTQLRTALDVVNALDLLDGERVGLMSRNFFDLIAV